MNPGSSAEQFDRALNILVSDLMRLEGKLSGDPEPECDCPEGTCPMPQQTRAVDPDEGLTLMARRPTARPPFKGLDPIKVDPIKIHDPVHSPSHYRMGDVECIDGIRSALGDSGFSAYCRGNAIKYAWRGGQKGAFSEDMAKARVYLQWAADADAGLPLRK